jgi:lysozyme
MKPRLQATRAVRELIKAYEPFHADAVRRGRRWMIGWGHRATAKEGASITPADAELLLIYDALRAQEAVNALVGADMPKASRDALASFAASIGLSAFKVSDVARLARDGRHREAAAALDSWVRAEEDGRLVVSDRLVKRRRAEKTLLLEGLDGALAAPPPDIVEAPSLEPALDEEPRIGPLVDVDIVFEDEPAAAPEATPEPAPEADDRVHQDGAEDASEGGADDDAPAAIVPETMDEADSEGDRKSLQDAAIAAVMSRMAADIAQSVGGATAAVDEVEAGPETEPEAEIEPEAEPEAAAPVKLGYSFLTPADVSVDADLEAESPGESAAAADDEAEPEAAATEPAGEPDAAPAPEAAPTPVYATVSISRPSKPDSAAPPHPALAPASAPGLSGESEGPDHPEDDEADAATAEDEMLEPAMVAGPEAVEPAPEPTPKSEGGWVYPALLGIGAVLTGLGGWELASHWEAYTSLGLEFSPLGPVVFGAGVLLAVGAGWFVFRKR